MPSESSRSPEPTEPVKWDFDVQRAVKLHRFWRTPHARLRPKEEHWPKHYGFAQECDPVSCRNVVIDFFTETYDCEQIMPMFRWVVIEWARDHDIDILIDTLNQCYVYLTPKGRQQCIELFAERPT